MKSPLILRVFKNNQLVEVKQFDQQQVVIGHNADVHLDLDADGVSPIHCLIELRDNGYYICDMGSQSGTFKNGQAVLDEILTSGDEVFVGPFKIVFFVGVPKPKMAPNETVVTAPVIAAVSTPAPTPIPPAAPVEPAVIPAAKPSAPAVEQPVREKPAVVPTSPPASAKHVNKPEIRATSNKSAMGKKKSPSGTYAPASEIKDLRTFLKPGKGAVLEVIVAWKERVLTTYHFRKKGLVKINQDIEMPPGFAPKNWTLIDISNGIKINTTADMTLELIQSAETMNQDAMIKSGRAQRAGQGSSARLDQGDMICITATGSELTLYVRYAPQSPIVPMLPPLML